MQPPTVDSLEQLAFIAAKLSETENWTLSHGERLLSRTSLRVPSKIIDGFREAIALGGDPLGLNFTRLKSAAARRPMGATYTPPSLVATMAKWVAAHNPMRVVDPGAGSGRFIVSAGRLMPRASLVAVEVDPFAALMARANLSVAGLACRSQVIVDDYCAVRLKKIRGRTAFLGNPPYVRHHDLSIEQKRWLTDAARELELDASRLAGLHSYFFVMTARISAPGDVGAFVTAAEWLDVNYGELLRRLLLARLGLCGLDVIEPTAKPFEDAHTTAVVSCFQVGQRHDKIPVCRVSSIEKLTQLGQGKAVSRERFETNHRWSQLLHSQTSKPRGYVELGELCRVHRGQVTGNNGVWIAGAHSAGLPKKYLMPSITRARELFAAGAELRDSRALRCIIDLPPEFDDIPAKARSKIEAFLKKAQEMGGNGGYVASHRRAWWSVGLHEPAPILASYMARRAPAFVRNTVKARHINIAHGIYPREELSGALLVALVEYLRMAVTVSDGRTYAGGLTKFEPKEMERLLVPGLELLRANAAVK